MPNGIPRHDTSGREFAQLDPAAFGQCFQSWTQQLHRQTTGQVIALDGKTLRHSFDTASGKGAIQIVSARTGGSGLVLGQVNVDVKTNEITALPILLELLDLSGCVVTADAMGCQKRIAKQIIEQVGIYVFALKDNHPLLHDEVRHWLAWGDTEGASDLACSFHQSQDYDHGRKEVHRCWTNAQVHWLDDTDGPAAWMAWRSLVKVQSQRMLNGKTTTACRNFPSSLPGDAKMLVSAVREHLGIENSLHWVLNMAYAEDTSRVRKDHAPQNLATLRLLAWNRLRQEKMDKDCVKSTARRQAGITTSCFKFLPREQMLNAIALTAGARTLAVTMVHF